MRRKSNNGLRLADKLKMEQNYIYAPALTSEFRCKVPLKETRQLFIVNGKVQGGKTPSPFGWKRGGDERDVQIISVRHKSYKEHLLRSRILFRKGLAR